MYALADCGSSNSWYSAGASPGDYLASMGCRKLDYLLLTHYDADHVNGLESCCRVAVDTLYLPDTEDDSGTRTWAEAWRRNTAPRSAM